MPVAVLVAALAITLLIGRQGRILQHRFALVHLLPGCQRLSRRNRTSGPSRASVTPAERTAIYLTAVTAEVADAPRLLPIVMFWGLVSLKNDPVYCPLPPVNSAPLQF